MSESFTTSLKTVLPSQPASISRKEHSHPATYALLHPSSDSAYVGSTSDLYKRLAHHNSDLKCGVHKNSNLQKAYDQNPYFDLVFAKAESKEEALCLEQELLINHFDSGKLFNLARDAVKAALGLVFTDEVRERLSQAAKEQFADPEARLAQSVRGKALWQDPEYRQKHEGVPKAEPTKRKIRDTVRELWQDPEYRARVAASRSANIKPVVIDGVTYPNIGVASRATGIPRGTLQSRRARNKL